MILVQVLEAQRRHQKEKSGIIPTSPTPYTYNKARLSAFSSTVWSEVPLARFGVEILVDCLSAELWLVVSWCDYLHNAVRLSSVLLEAPQSHHPKGHEEEDYDGQLWLSWRWMEPDLWDGQGHSSQVSLCVFFATFLKFKISLVHLDYELHIFVFKCFAFNGLFISSLCFYHLVICSLQAAEGKAGGEADYWGSLGSPVAQLHRGPRQRAAVRTDDDGQGLYVNYTNPD